MELADRGGMGSIYRAVGAETGAPTLQAHFSCVRRNGVRFVLFSFFRYRFCQRKKCGASTRYSVLD
jgi:hypothetical protein